MPPPPEPPPAHPAAPAAPAAQVELLGNDNLQELKERLVAEIRVLQQLKHRNIITFYDWWFDPRSQCVNFITEYFTSGTLRQVGGGAGRQ